MENTPQQVVIQFGGFTNASLRNFWETMLLMSDKLDSGRKALLYQESCGTRVLPRCITFEEKIQRPILDEENAPFNTKHQTNQTLPSNIILDPKYRYELYNVKGSFEEGKIAGNKAEVRESGADLIRQQIERCDWFNGLTVITDASGFWGGLSGAIMEGVHDELGVRQVEAFGSFFPSCSKAIRLIDQALNLYSLHCYSKHSIPMLLDYDVDEKFVNRDGKLVNQEEFYQDISSILQLCYSSTERLCSIEGFYCYSYRFYNSNNVYSPWKSLLTGRNVTGEQPCRTSPLVVGSFYRRVLPYSQFSAFNGELVIKPLQESTAGPNFIRNSILKPLQSESSLKKLFLNLEDSENILQLLESLVQ